jgi:hypothetical protein
MSKKEQTYPRPKWLPKDVVEEEELCPDCFKVVGVRSRYKLVCMLGKKPDDHKLVPAPPRGPLTRTTYAGSSRLSEPRP